MRRRVLFWFTADYPSVFKPYFDTQLAVMAEAGVDVIPIAFRPGPGPWSDLCLAEGLDRRVRYLADDLAALRTSWVRTVSRLISHPLVHLPRLARASGAAGPLRRRLGFLVRGAGLPPVQPSALFVNNLETLVRLRFLRRAFPGTPLAFYYHGGEPAAAIPVEPREARVALQLPDVSFTNTAWSADELVNRGAPERTVRVAPMGFRLEDYPLRPEVSWPEAGHPVEVLSIGRLSREKGHEVAVTAIARVASRTGREFRYHLVGDGPERRRLEAQARGAGLGDRVVFHGALDSGRLAALVASVHLALQPSLALGDWTENQACVVQEMMLRGVPVIASRSGGMPECTAPSLRKLMPTPGDPEALALAVSEILSLSNSAIGEIVAEGRAFAQQSFNARAIVGRMLAQVGLA